MRPASLVFAVLLTLTGCSTAATPSDTPDATTTATPTASPPASAGVGVLEGHWTTGPVPIGDIKASMIAAGISAADVDAWVADVGSPSEFSFELDFNGFEFTHYQETPGALMALDESGTFTLSGTELVLTVGEAGNIDTYTLRTTLSDDDLSMQWISSTEEGAPEGKERHRRFTIALYCSAVFRRA